MTWVDAVTLLLNVEFNPNRKLAREVAEAVLSQLAKPRNLLDMSNEKDIMWQGLVDGQLCRVVKCAERDCFVEVQMVGVETTWESPFGDFEHLIGETLIALLFDTRDEVARLSQIETKLVSLCDEWTNGTLAAVAQSIRQDILGQVVTVDSDK